MPNQLLEDGHADPTPLGGYQVESIVLFRPGVIVSCENDTDAQWRVALAMAIRDSIPVDGPLCVYEPRMRVADYQTLFSLGVQPLEETSSSAPCSRYVTLVWLFSEYLDTLEQLVRRRWTAWDISSVLFMCPSVSLALENEPLSKYVHLRHLQSSMVELKVPTPGSSAERSSFKLADKADQFVLSSFRDLSIHFVPFALAFQNDWHPIE